MSLRSKIVLILAVVALLYVALEVTVMRAMVAEPFRVLEEGEIKKDSERVQAGLDGVVDDLAVRARVLGSRPDALMYVQGNDPAFEGRVLGNDPLQEFGVNLLFVCDADGNVLWSKCEESGTQRAVELPEFSSERIDDGHPLHLVRRKGDPTQGIMNTANGPVLVAMHAIEDSSGKYAGAVIAGRFFDTAMRSELLKRTRVNADVYSAFEPLPDQDPDAAQSLRDRVTGNMEPVIDYLSDQRVDVYVSLDNVMKHPTLILRSSFDRSITEGGGRILDFAILSTVATALLMLLALLRLLERIVLKPLSILTGHAKDIGRTEDMSKRVGMKRDDELGRLSEEFDGLMGKLQKSREQVIETARVAGMSEIATGILHNVGNVLNSVNVSTNLAKTKAESLAVNDLTAMTGVLESQDDLGRFVAEDPRGKKFLPFLSELTREMSSQRTELLDELASLGTGVDHVIELVRNQQSYAGMSGVFEPTDLGEAIDSAIAICEQSYTLPKDLTLTRDYEDMEKVPVDRHKLMEILVNLIQNASQAMRDAATAGKELVCRVRTDGDHVCIEVVDNGPGIEGDNLARIFSHGFTTRKDGHGFGLHMSANAATEMKGALHAESDGPGTGATFILRLPRRINKAAAAA